MRSAKLAAAKNWCENARGWGFTSAAFRSRFRSMDTVFDDLSSALREPHRDVWGKVRVIVLDLLGKLFLGIAIGLGIGIGLVLAG